MTINSDGKVKVVGTYDETYDFTNWKNVKSVTVGFYNAACITEIGEVIVTGINDSVACATSDWKNVCMVAITPNITFGVTEDGEVLHTKPLSNYRVPQLLLAEVQNWKDLQFIGASGACVAGIDFYGNVKAVSPLYPEIARNVRGWKRIQYLSVATDAIAGINMDGEVLIALNSKAKPVKASVLSALKGAKKVCIDKAFVAGLMPDDSLKVIWFGDAQHYQDSILALDNEQDIADIYSYDGYLVVLKKDGTILAPEQ